MSEVNVWEERAQEEYLKFIPILFEKIKDRMPKYIVSNQVDTLTCLLNLDKELENLKSKIFQIEKSTFAVFFPEEIEKIIVHIESNPNKDLAQIMLPAIHELVDIKWSYKTVLEDYDKEKNQSNVAIILNHEDSSYEWEMKAKQELNYMSSNLNLKSVQVSQGASWKDIYEWAQSTHEAIKESQETVGLEPFHAGLNQTVNISFNPESLKQTRGNGKMFANEFVNTLVLTSFDKSIQKVIWQHEYAHILDNQVGIKLLKEQLAREEKEKEKTETNVETFRNDYNGFEENLVNNYQGGHNNNNNDAKTNAQKNNKINSCTFLSQMEMEIQLNDREVFWSSNDSMYKAQVWMVEALSDVVYGTSSETLKEYNRKCAKEFSKILVENFNIQFIGEQNWLLLDETIKFNLLNSQKVIEYVDSVVEEIYQNGVRKFFTSYWENEENVEKFKNITKFVKEEVGNNYLFENAEEKFKEKLPGMSWDFLNVMKKYGYSNTNKQVYFPKSKTVVAAAQHSLKYISPYHTRVLEIFARSCEDLQRPLILSTQEYFNEKESKLMNTEDFMNPQLNRNERKVFLKTVHALIEALGMKVNKQLDNLPALKETVINTPDTTYSSLSENEEIASVILNTGTRKSNKMY